MKKIALLALIAAAISGCASVAVNDDSLQTRTAQALNLQPTDFTISNRSDNGIRTDYTVTTHKKQVYSCYVTGTVSIMGRVVSDAVCTPISGGSSGKPAPTPKASSCNDLLRAAGKC